MTRIEDLGEYLHELGKNEEDTSTSDSSEVPEIPTEEIDFGSTDFTTSEESSFNTEETTLCNFRKNHLFSLGHFVIRFATVKTL